MDEDEIPYKDLPWHTKLSVRWNWIWYYHVARKRETLLVWFAHRLPREIAYRAAFRIGADATTGAYSRQEVPALTFMDAMERWPLRQGGDRTNRKTRDDQVILTDEQLGKYTYEDDQRSHDLAVAICHTVDYIGTETLPAKPGWSWFDVLDQHYPEMAQQYIDGDVGEKGARCSYCHKMQTLRYGMIRAHVGSTKTKGSCNGSGKPPLGVPLNLSNGE